MRAIFSYGVALILVLIVAVWLGSGMLVIGGKGPGNGEKPVISLAQGGAPADALTKEAADKAQAAADAKANSDAAAKAAADAATQANAVSDAKRKQELTDDLAAKTKAAEEAKAKSDEAAAAAAKVKAEADAAQQAATATSTELNTTLTIAERNAQKGDGAIETPRSVRIQQVSAQAMPIEVPLRGKTKAKSSVSVVAQTAGTIQLVSVTKGQSVKAGDLLCTLDQGSRKAAVDQAQASVDQAQTAFESNQSLVKKGLAAQNTTLAAESALKAARSGLENAQLELSRTEIKSPIDGVVQDPLAAVGSTLAMGAPCATVVQLDPMLFIASVPEAKMTYAKLDLPATVTTVSGQTATGKVTFIAATADDATRSFPIEISIPNADGTIRDGVTAEATVNVGTAPALLLPQSVLTLDDDGVLGIRTVEDGNKVAFHAVNIVKDTREGVWVVGLPMQINVITVGQEFVQPGQIVDAKTDPTPIGTSPTAASVATTASGEQPS